MDLLSWIDVTRERRDGSVGTPPRSVARSHHLGNRIDRRSVVVVDRQAVTMPRHVKIPPWTRTPLTAARLVQPTPPFDL